MADRDESAAQPEAEGGEEPASGLSAEAAASSGHTAGDATENAPEGVAEDASEPSPLGAAERLEAVARLVRACRDCALHRGRRNAVPGAGSPAAEVLFVGEGPGEVEDQRGLPFVGPAGQLLDELLASIELSREDVFVTNVVKCRPPGNRTPLPDERKACMKYLGKQIEYLRPRVLCTLGAAAFSVVARGDQYISRSHGRPIQRRHYVLVPLYHPAAALHNPQLRETLFADIKVLGQVLSELRRMPGA
jgi:uracil-DNA glycosylase